MLGVTGQLGREICRKLGPAAVPLHRNTANLNNSRQLRTALITLRPDVVINCAAWTDVDAAEGSPEACHAVNAYAVRQLATSCNDISATFVQLSTDYVYGGTKNRVVPYAEADLASPVNTYGESKLAGEIAASQAKKNLIIRTSGLYSVSDRGPVRGRNFADTMLCLARDKRDVKIVGDQHCTPSFVPHVADGILDLLLKQSRGLFHVVNTGSTTWHGFASALFQAAGISVTTQKITSDQFPAAALRPLFSVLSTDKFVASTGRSLPDWRTGIAEYIKSMKPHLSRMERVA